jgi:hypothetical protein
MSDAVAQDSTRRHKYGVVSLPSLKLHHRYKAFFLCCWGPSAIIRA